MHPERGPTRIAPPYPRFRCLVCKEFVVGTESGHCPRCGFVPPSAPNVPATRPFPRHVIVYVAIALGLLLAYFLGH